MRVKYLKFALDIVKNIVGKKENAGYHHFLLPKNVFRGLLSQSYKNTELSGKELTLYQITNFRLVQSKALSYNKNEYD